MPKSTRRYQMSPQAIAALRHDGTGWDHDITRGCLRLTYDDGRQTRLTRLSQRIRKGF
ncbi:hypothetical protein [Yoonia sp. SS1-5]|uniref:Uncharacterized protein n=1 Tax=Yoonia rhodophyticola TaxID=3137370 RepID=A0AAN0M7U5_9RHOB